MRLSMYYPSDKRNKNFDGKVHIIKALNLRCIRKNGIELYLLDYDDETLKKKRMVTLLGKSADGVFYKIPLSNYRSLRFDELNAEMMLFGEEVELEELGKEIKTLSSCSDIVDVLNGKVKFPPKAASSPVPPPDPPKVRYALDSKSPRPPKIDKQSAAFLTKPKVPKTFIFYNRKNKKFYYDPVCVREVDLDKFFVKLNAYEKKACEEHNEVLISRSSVDGSSTNHDLYIYSINTPAPTENDYLFNTEKLINDLINGLYTTAFPIFASADFRDKDMLYHTAMSTIKEIARKFDVYSKLISNQDFKYERYNECMDYFKQLSLCNNMLELSKFQDKHKTK